MNRSVILGITVLGLMAGGWAQSSNNTQTTTTTSNSGSGIQNSEFSIQISGVLTTSSNNTPTTHLATNSAGLLVGYRVHLNHWEALEIEYGYTRNGQRYFTPGTTPGAPGTNYAITANMQQVIANEVVTTPRLFGVLQPFILGGGGLVIFQPRSTSAALASSQNEGAGNYGAGVDFHIAHLGARLEYQGLIMKIPDFHNVTLNVNKWTNVSQPSLGLIFTF